jgi:hypothetical protein
VVRSRKRKATQPEARSQYMSRVSERQGDEDNGLQVRQSRDTSVHHRSSQVQVNIDHTRGKRVHVFLHLMVMRNMV